MSAAKKTTKRVTKQTAKKAAKKATRKVVQKTTARAAEKTTARATKKTTKTVARKTTSTTPGSLAVDGSQLDAILDLAGARKPRKASKPSSLTRLEKQLGRPVPGELQKYLARGLDLDHPDAYHSEIRDTSFAGELPDVPAWLEQLKKPAEGALQAIQQLAGLYPLGVKLERGDHLWVFAGLDRYSELDSGGVFYFDDRELGGFYPGTISGFLLHELRAHHAEYERTGDMYEMLDTFCFNRKDPAEKPPESLALAPEIAAAFDRRAHQLTARYDRIATILLFIRGGAPYLPGLPTAALWLAERDSLADDHAAAMYWLLAHWLFDNGPELADAVARTRGHRSPLVAALRDHVAEHHAVAAFALQQTALFDAVRLAAAAE